MVVTTGMRVGLASSVQRPVVLLTPPANIYDAQDSSLQQRMTQPKISVTGYESLLRLRAHE